MGPHFEAACTNLKKTVRSQVRPVDHDHGQDDSGPSPLRDISVQLGIGHGGKETANDRDLPVESPPTTQISSSKSISSDFRSLSMESPSRINYTSTSRTVLEQEQNLSALQVQEEPRNTEMPRRSSRILDLEKRRAESEPGPQAEQPGPIQPLATGHKRGRGRPRKEKVSTPVPTPVSDRNIELMELRDQLNYSATLSQQVARRYNKLLEEKELEKK